MKEEQFIPLPSQGTIYSIARLGNHILVGTGTFGKVKVHSSKNVVEDVPLVDLPGEADIVAIDAYVDTCPVIAVAYIMKAIGDGEDGKGFLNIYSTWNTEQESPPLNQTMSRFTFQRKEEVDSSELELIGRHCKSFRLGYLPYHLYHVPVLKSNGSYGNVFLLSGCDRRIHTFESDEGKLTFTEVPTKVYFPELSQAFRSIVTRIQINCVNDILNRVTICGFEDGKLKVWIAKKKVSNASSEQNSPSHRSRSASLSSSDINEDKDADGVEDGDPNKDDGDSDSDSEVSVTFGGETFEAITHTYDGIINSIQSYSDGFQLNVIVASALSPTFTYTNVIEENFATGTPLKFSNRWDSVLACCVADVDMDGRAEIILGTFGCTLLVYKFMDDLLPQWVIVAHKKFPSGILGIEWVNCYLHVITTGGIHVIEYSTTAYFHKHGLHLSPGTIVIPEEIKKDEDVEQEPS